MSDIYFKKKEDVYDITWPLGDMNLSSLRTMQIFRNMTQSKM
jgi:hypothetical protein